jgi:N-acetylmuramoyl-L-alanine amidase
MKKIYINPGHSDRDPGAIGYETERRLNVSVSQHMRDYLLAHYDCEVKMNPGTMGDLATVCAEANKWGAALFVSNHFNAGKGDGYECFVYSEARRPLGQIFEKHVKAAGQNSRGVKVKPAFIVLNSTDMPAILNEGAFVDNKQDIGDWNDDAELQKLGIAYAKAAAEYLKLEKKAAPVAPAAPETVTVKMEVLKKGSAGDQVETLQRILKSYGYDLGSTCPFDGDFGSKTDAAVRSYQKKNGLTSDGVVGEKTWKKLLGTQ